MKISYDEAKRQWTLENRGLDFEDAPEVLTGTHVVLKDDRKSYSEDRMQTYGHLNGRLVMFAWIPTPEGMRIFSMRKCNEREQRKFNHWTG